MQNRRSDAQILLSAKDCAARLGISIRALRLYEQHGLIAPKRTEKHWRLYGHQELVRLNEILALKTLGLSLRDIAKLLRGQTADLRQTLALQQDALKDTQARASRGLQLIESLQTKLQSGATPTIDDLTNLVRQTQMTEPLHDTAAWRRYEQMRPRTETPIDSTLLDDYVGAYETAEGTLSIVTATGSHLAHRIVGQEDLDLFAEAADHFFMKVLPVQIAFQRDDTGRVQGLVHHQSGYEMPATRTDLSATLAIEAALQDRIRKQQPLPGGEDRLRHLIDAFAHGKPDLDAMEPVLAALIMEEQEEFRNDLQKAGALQTLTFKGIQNGLDIYDARFDTAKLECGLALTHRGKISHLYLRPAL